MASETSLLLKDTQFMPIFLIDTRKGILRIQLLKYMVLYQQEV